MLVGRGGAGRSRGTNQGHYLLSAACETCRPRVMCLAALFTLPSLTLARGKSVGISLLLAGSSESSPCGVKLFHWNFSSITISRANSTSSSSSSSSPLGSFFLTQLSHFTITLLLPRGKPSRPVTLDLCSQIMASGLQPNFRTTAATS